MAYQVRGDLSVARRSSAGLAVNVPEWQAGKDYVVNDMFLDNGIIYTVTADHTSTTSPTADIANLSKAEVPVDDQSASGYIDIGNMRMQWGTVFQSGVDTTHDLPAPFASAAYTISASGSDMSNGYNATVNARPHTASQFRGVSMRTNPPAAASAGHNVFLHYVAIGLKP